ncbi:MAG: sugar phosphate nucleotidyltransferase [bacterium]|nr:sugar phosphate nucleotidyltransferase [bacterium]
MQAVILAAGESSRFWPLNEKHKTLIKICGRPLIGSLIEELKKSGLKDIIVVQSPIRDIERELKDKSLKYAIQKKPWGTGDALLAAEKLIKSERFFLFNADDNEVGENIKTVLARAEKGVARLVLLASRTRTPWLFGILRTRGKRVMEIVEKPQLGQEPSRLKNDNFFLFPREFFDYLKKVPRHPFSLIYALNLYAQQDPVEMVLAKRATLSLKYPWHLFPILEARLTETGFKTKIARTAKIGKNVVISGRVVIGDNTRISANTVIQGPGYIGRDCEIGVSNVLRGPFDLEDGVKTGAFMEIKNSLVQAGTHFHSGYLGDSLIGSDCRFGAGLVTANRRIDRGIVSSVVKGKEIVTGLTYLGTAVGNRSRFGIQIGVMPGVLVGKNCTIWPGTIVFENVSDGIVWK